MKSAEVTSTPLSHSTPQAPRSQASKTQQVHKWKFKDFCKASNDDCWRSKSPLNGTSSSEILGTAYAMRKLAKTRNPWEELDQKIRHFAAFNKKPQGCDEMSITALFGHQGLIWCGDRPFEVFLDIFQWEQTVGNCFYAGGFLWRWTQVTVDTSLDGRSGPEGGWSGGEVQPSHEGGSSSERSPAQMEGSGLDGSGPEKGFGLEGDQPEGDPPRQRQRRHTARKHLQLRNWTKLFITQMASV